MLIRISLVIACVAICACRDVSFPVPPQRTSVKYYINAVLDWDKANPSLPQSVIIGGVQPDIQRFGWSWVYPRAEFRVPLEPASNWELTARVTAVADVLTKAGPQTLTFQVNGHTLKSLRLDRPGTSDLQIPIGPRIIGLSPTNDIVLTTAPCLVQPESPPLCVLLQRIGFTREIL